MVIFFFFRLYQVKMTKRGQTTTNYYLSAKPVVKEAREHLSQMLAELVTGPVIEDIFLRGRLLWRGLDGILPRGWNTYGGGGRTSFTG